MATLSVPRVMWQYHTRFSFCKQGQQRGCLSRVNSARLPRDDPGTRGLKIFCRKGNLLNASYGWACPKVDLVCTRNLGGGRACSVDVLVCSAHRRKTVVLEMSWHRGDLHYGPNF